MRVPTCVSDQSKANYYADDRRRYEEDNTGYRIPGVPGNRPPNQKLRVSVLCRTPTPNNHMGCQQSRLNLPQWQYTRLHRLRLCLDTTVFSSHMLCVLSPLCATFATQTKTVAAITHGEGKNRGVLPVVAFLYRCVSPLLCAGNAPHSAPHTRLCTPWCWSSPSTRFSRNDPSISTG